MNSYEHSNINNVTSNNIHAINRTLYNAETNCSEGFNYEGFVDSSSSLTHGFHHFVFTNERKRNRS
jgi:hypothetical protein